MICRRLLRRWREDRGSAAIEVAIGLPAFLLFVGLIIAGGRAAIAHQSVESAAADAARQASISRSAGLAQGDAEAAAQLSLTQQGLQCASKTVTVDTSGFGVPVGEAAKVQATVDCEVNVADLAVPGLPGTVRMTATVGSPIDTYRERS